MGKGKKSEGRVIKTQIITVRRYLTVEPSFLSDGRDRVEVSVCSRCACIVFDPVVHYGVCQGANPD